MDFKHIIDRRKTDKSNMKDTVAMTCGGATIILDRDGNIVSAPLESFADSRRRSTRQSITRG